MRRGVSLVLEVPTEACVASRARLAAELACVCGFRETRWGSRAWRSTGVVLMACEGVRSSVKLVQVRVMMVQVLHLGVPACLLYCKPRAIDD